MHSCRLTIKHTGLIRSFNSASSCAEAGRGTKGEAKEEQRRIRAGQEPHIYLLVLGRQR